MDITHVVTEFSPLIKVGGIADVLQGFAKETKQQGANIQIFLPKYDCLDTTLLALDESLAESIPCHYKGSRYQNKVWKTFFNQLPIYLIEPPKELDFFRRGMVYGCPDDVNRFLYFSRSVMDFLAYKKESPDILHLHDWHTAACAPLYYDQFEPLLPGKTRIVFTIHNLEYQGLCSPSDLNDIGLDGPIYLDPGKLQDNYTPSTVNLLKGGIVYSNFVTTVSPRYAEEALTPEGGRGLDPTLSQYKDKFIGILNGIDTDYWDPEKDPCLPHHFKPSWSLSRILSTKMKIRNELRKQFHLSIDKDAPLGICIARLVPQKGLDLIEHAMRRILDQGGQFFLMGETLIPEVTARYEKIQKELAGTKRAHIQLSYDEKLAHIAFAAGDFVLVPSIFEPCGLVQMIAMRYGTIPIVRKTGGLSNTVFDIDYALNPPIPANGYTFDTPDSCGVDSALDRAMNDWSHNREKWGQLVQSTLNQDFGWKHSIKLFFDLYKRLVD